MPPYDPPNAFYTEVQIPYYVDTLKVMGRNGRHLKWITEKSGCQYVWVDLIRRVVEIWGPEDKLKYGIAKVRQHIAHLTRVTEPVELQNLHPDVRQRITARAWCIGSQTLYEVEGPELYCKVFFDEIRRLFPFRPYMTQIKKMTDRGFLISRFSSCD
jgi:hypothetical protein